MLATERGGTEKRRHYSSTTACLEDGGTTATIHKQNKLMGLTSKMIQQERRHPQAMKIAGMVLKPTSTDDAIEVK